MPDWGTVPLNSTIPFFFATFDGQLGGSLTMTGLALADIQVYKGTSMTQRSSTAGIVLLDTDGIDVDTTTGIHGFSIDTSDNTDAGFYVAGAFYTVVVASITVDAVTVNFVAGTFYLTPATSIAGQQKVDVGGWLGTAPATPTVNGVPEVDLTHVAGSTTNVSTLATDVQAIIVDTGTTLQAELDGIQADTEDIQTRLPAALVSGRMDSSVGAMAANVITAAATAADFSTEVNAAILAVLGALADAAADGDPTATDTMVAYLKQLINTLEGTAGLPTFPAAANPANAVSIVEVLRSIHANVGAAGAGLTAVPWNASWDAEVQSEALDALDTILADSVPADGTLPTLRQAIYMFIQFLFEGSVSGLTYTVKKVDGTTTLFTLTLNDASSPTSITRAT